MPINIDSLVFVPPFFLIFNTLTPDAFIDEGMFFVEWVYVYTLIQKGPSGV